MVIKSTLEIQRGCRNEDYPWDSSQLLNLTIAVPLNELETTSVYYVNKLGPLVILTCIVRRRVGSPLS